MSPATWSGIASFAPTKISSIMEHSDCLYSPPAITFTVIFSFFAAVNFGATVWFVFDQLKKKGRAAFTRFTILAMLQSIGMGTMCVSFSIITPQKYCGVLANLIALPFAGVGLIISYIAYSLFIFFRSQALLSPNNKILLAFMITLSNVIIIVEVILNSIIGGGYYNPPLERVTSPTERIVMITLGMITGLPVLITDTTYLIVFIGHLRKMKLKTENWLILTKDDDALRVIAKIGLRCQVILSLGNAANIPAVAITFDEQIPCYFQVFIMFFLTMLGMMVFYMKYTVDQVQNEKSSFDATNTIGSVIHNTSYASDASKSFNVA